MAYRLHCGCPVRDCSDRGGSVAQSQKTLAGPVEIEGVGLHSGRRAWLRILPGRAGSGILFIRRDLDGVGIPAAYRLLNGSNFSTTLSRGPAVVGTVGGVLSARRG